MSDESRPRSGGDSSRSRNAYDKALDLLALRPHFSAELAAKLSRRGFPREAVDLVVDRLEGEGYLDDLEASRSFARQRVSRKSWGPRRLRAELARRGVDEGEVDRVLGEAFPAGELEAAREAARRWAARGGDGRDRLARYLDRRGFSKGPIIEILSELAPGAEADLEER